MVENKTYRISASFSAESLDIDKDYQELMGIFHDYPIMQSREGGELIPMQGEDYCFREKPKHSILRISKMGDTVLVDIRQTNTLDDVLEVIERIKTSSAFKQEKS